MWRVNVHLCDTWTPVCMTCVRDGCACHACVCVTRVRDNKWLGASIIGFKLTA